MSYGSVRNRSTISIGKDYCSLNSDGSVRSNDIIVARSISSGMADSLGHGNEMAYDAHARRGEYD